MTGSQKHEADTLPPSLVHRLGVSLLAAGTTVVILFTAGGFLARYSWRLELMCHFRVQYLWICLTAAALLWLARRKRLAGVALAGAIVNSALVLPIYWPARQPAKSAERLTLVSFNVLGSNVRYDEVREFLARERADVVLLMEVRPHWAEQCELLRDLYPHQHVVPRADNFGIALLSRKPLRAIATRDFGITDAPAVVAEIELAGQTVVIVGAHPFPPGSEAAASERNKQLSAIASYVREQDHPVLVAGDLNVTSFSPYFGDLLRSSGLRDCRQGFGVQATWSAPLPLVEIAIDHCLVSPQLRVHSRRVGSHLGSDHRPVMVELGLSRP